jgi:hypothetical protein
LDLTIHLPGLCPHAQLHRLFDLPLQYPIPIFWHPDDVVL